MKLLIIVLLIAGSLSFSDTLNENVPKSGITSTTVTATEVKEDSSASVSENKNFLKKLKNNEVEWKLVWRDEFDGTELDKKKWSYWEDENPWNPGNYVDENGNLVNRYGFNTKHYYFKENVKVENGNLVIGLKKEEDRTVLIDGKEGKVLYSSGAIHTRNTYNVKYGKIEMRAAMPKGVGVWPAFWTWPENYSSLTGVPAKEEIDIFEIYGDNLKKVTGTAHALKSDNTYASFIGKDLKIRKNEDLTDFNTYAVEWNEKEIKWFFNGRKYKTLSMKKVAKSSENTFKLPHFLMINVALQNKTGEDGDIYFPTEMKVDYVRVYQK